MSLMFAAAVLTVAVGPGVATRSQRRPKLKAIAATVLTPGLAVVLFYSLAMHMHVRLGGWPSRIGTEGFPSSLVLHSDIASFPFGALVLGVLYVLPIAVLLCIAVAPLREHLTVLGVYGLACFLALGLISLAPEPFLTWWWD